MMFYFFLLNVHYIINCHKNMKHRNFSPFFLTYFRFKLTGCERVSQGICYILCFKYQIKHNQRIQKKQYRELINICVYIVEYIKLVNNRRSGMYARSVNEFQTKLICIRDAGGLPNECKHSSVEWLNYLTNTTVYCQDGQPYDLIMC